MLGTVKNLMFTDKERANNTMKKHCMLCESFFSEKIKHIEKILKIRIKSVALSWDTVG